MNYKISFVESVCRWVHVYHVESLHNQLLYYKDQLLQDFIDLPREDTKQFKVANKGVKNDFVTSLLRGVFTDIVTRYYHIGETYTTSIISAYAQNIDNSVNDFHHHYHQNNIIGVTYISPPKEGGELEILIPPDLSSYSFKIKPLPDHVYIFAGFVLHRPLPHNTKDYRISLNWGLNTTQRPIHKLTGDLW